MELDEIDGPGAVDVDEGPEPVELRLGEREPEDFREDVGELGRIDQPRPVRIKLLEGRQAIVGREAILCEELPGERLQFDELPLLPHLHKVGADRLQRHRQEAHAD